MLIRLVACCCRSSERGGSKHLSRRTEKIRGRKPRVAPLISFQPLSSGIESLIATASRYFEILAFAGRAASAPPARPVLISEAHHQPRLKRSLLGKLAQSNLCNVGHYRNERQLTRRGHNG